jgi:hypothetical protein
MDDIFLDLFPPMNDFDSGDSADIPFDDWIAQFEPFADEPPEPSPAPVPVISELPEEGVALATQPSMDSQSHPREILPAGPVELPTRRRGALYKPTCAILISSKRVNKKPMEKGNNVYGRAGTLRCELCRRRRLKVPILKQVNILKSLVVYIHVNRRTLRAVPKDGNHRVREDIGS